MERRLLSGGKELQGSAQWQWDPILWCIQFSVFGSTFHFHSAVTTQLNYRRQLLGSTEDNSFVSGLTERSVCVEVAWYLSLHGSERQVEAKLKQGIVAILQPSSRSWWPGTWDPRGQCETHKRIQWQRSWPCTLRWCSSCWDQAETSPAVSSAA